jgi:regulatory protein
MAVNRSPDHAIARSPDRTAYVDGLHLLARRELSVRQLRERLRDREHAETDIDRAIALLIENRALDDRRVAAAYVRTALQVKGRGRLRIQRELQAMGIESDVAKEALAEAFGAVDERAMVAQAVKKKLRGKTTVSTPAEYSRLYQFLMRQGFSPAAVNEALRAYRRSGRLEDDPSA